MIVCSEWSRFTGVLPALEMVLVCMGSSFIDLWIGEGYSEIADPIMLVLTIAFIVSPPSTGLRAMLVGTGSIQAVTLVNIAIAIFTIGLLFYPSIYGECWGSPGQFLQVVSSSMVWLFQTSLVSSTVFLLQIIFSM